jgi:hypothetical protein
MEGKTMKLEEVNKWTKEAADFLVAALESGHSEVLTAYLGEMAKFHTYSFGNIMLIARQRAMNMLPFLAGVNEHAALRLVGSKRWRVSHLLRTIQFFSTMEFTS